MGRRQPLAVVLASCGVSALIILRHRANIRRLIEGKEPRLSFGSSGGS
jgi:glycerol-3-phosphate acyltransferase PlsY